MGRGEDKRRMLQLPERDREAEIYRRQQAFTFNTRLQLARIQPPQPQNRYFR
jgi:hypothetical protein